MHLLRPFITIVEKERKNKKSRKGKNALEMLFRGTLLYPRYALIVADRLLPQSVR